MIVDLGSINQGTEAQSWGCNDTCWWGRLWWGTRERRQDPEFREQKLHLSVYLREHKSTGGEVHKGMKETLQGGKKKKKSTQVKYIVSGSYEHIHKGAKQGTKKPK